MSAPTDPGAARPLKRTQKVPIGFSQNRRCRGRAQVELRDIHAVTLAHESSCARAEHLGDTTRREMPKVPA
eukprot:3565906-Pyramimonas_sp.AAC.1